MKTLAIIPARGGSKGIPRKNLRPLAGKPLIYYCINACLQSSMISEIVVSTDDDEIAMFANRFGADVLLRPESLSNDKVTLDPVITHAYKWSCINYDTSFDTVITVQPTSPLIQSDNLDNALLLFKNGFDTIISVVDDRHLSWKLDSGNAVPNYKARVNRQELPANFKETGAIIACKAHVLEKNQSRIGENIGLFEIEHERSFDIDSISEFQLCESLLSRKNIVFHIKGNSKIG